MSESTGASSGEAVRYPARLRKFAAIIFVLACAFAIAQFKVHDLDVWFHLKAGELISNTGKVPRVDTFSAPNLGRPWDYHEWLAGWLFFKTYDLFGFGGFTLVKSLSVAVIALVLFLAARLRGAGPWIASGMITIALLAARFRLNDRPHLFEFLGIALYLAILARADSGRSRWLLWLIPVQVLWTNSHGSFLLGPLMLTTLLVSSLLPQQVGQWRSASSFRDAVEPRDWALALVATTAATFLNPYGPRLLAAPFRAEQHVSAKLLITEWRPSQWADLSPYLMVLVFLSLYGLTGLLRRRVVPLRDLALVSPFVILAFRAVRFHAEVALVLAPLAAGWYASMSERRTPTRSRIFRVVLPTATAIALGAIVAHELRSNTELVPGIGLHPHLYPVGAANFIEQIDPPGTLGSSYGFGGYFIWRFGPQKRVLLDGRAEIYDQELLWSLLGEKSVSSWKGALDSYDVRTLITFRIPEPAEQAALAAASWTLAFYDDLSAVWIRRVDGEGGATVGETLVFLTELDAAGRRFQTDPGACRELQKLVELSPHHFLTAYQLGRCLHAQGPGSHDAAIQSLERALRVRPDAGALNDLGLMLGGAGRIQQAERAFQDALAVDPSSLPAAFNLAELLWAQGRFEAARTHYRMVLATPQTGLEAQKAVAARKLAVAPELN